MNFEKNLVYLRKKKNLSQEDLAYLTGVTRQTIYTWEAGLNYPNILMLKKLANALDVSTDDLLNGFEVNKLPKEIKKIVITDIKKHDEKVLYEELPNWFVKLKKDEEVNWALYDLIKGKYIRDYSYHIDVLGDVLIHDEKGIEIKVKEYDPDLNFRRTYNQFVTMNDEGVAWLGEVTYKDGIKKIQTYKDQEFLNDWGYDKKFIYQACNYENAVDAILEVDGKKLNVIKISYFDPDGSDTDLKHAYFEVLLNQDYDSLMWRRYTKKADKKELSNEVILVDGIEYDMDYYSITSRL